MAVQAVSLDQAPPLALRMAQASEFVYEVFRGAPADSHVVAWRRRDRLASWIPLASSGTVSGLAIAGEQDDLYVGITPKYRRDEVDPETGEITREAPPLRSWCDRRGTAGDTAAVTCLWADVDTADGVHTADGLPTRDEALATLRATGLDLLTVDSGGGYQAYVLLAEPVDPETGATLEGRYLRLLRERLQEVAPHRNVRAAVDSVGDLARVLRVPGTWNAKGGERRPVTIVDWSANRSWRRYSAAELDEILPAAEPQQRTAPRTHTTHTDRKAAADAERAAQHCSFIRHCVDDGETLPEPEWYHGTIGIGAYCRDGKAVVHHWSEPYPRYSAEETEAKIEHHLRDAGAPTTCAYIAGELGWEGCQACQWRGKITSPIQLGRSRGKVIELRLRQSDERNTVRIADGNPGNPSTFRIEELPEPDERPPFPTPVLPSAIRRFVEEGARSLVAPADYVGTAILATASAFIGTSRVIRLKEGWDEPALDYFGLVGPPGAKKTPAMKLSLSFAHRRESEFERTYRSLQALYQDDLRAWQEEDKETRGPKPEPPGPPQHIVVSDTTMEKLAELLLQNPRGLLLQQDELTGWVRDLSRYNQGGDRGKYLSLWAQMPLIVDRIKYGDDRIYVERPFLTVIGGIQPDLIREMAPREAERFATDREDGFLHRFLFAFPAVTTDRWAEDTLPASTWRAAGEVFDRLAMLQPQEGQPVPVVMSPGAKAAWVAWYDEHAAELGELGDYHPLRGVWAKMPAHLARLTLILHGLRFAAQETEADTVVDEATMRGGIELVTYYKAHAQLAYGEIDLTPTDRMVRRALEWIRKDPKRVRDGVTARDLVTARLVKKTTEAQWLLDEMVDRGHGGLEDRKARNNKPIQVFVLR